MSYPCLESDTLAQVATQLAGVVRTGTRGSLDAEQLTELRERIASQLAAIERLHAYPLSNADEPAWALVPMPPAPAERHKDDR